MSEPSNLRVEKIRARGVVTLTTGAAIPGHFFVAPAAADRPGRERVADLLNAEPGFFPFEVQDGGRPCAVLYNRMHVLAVSVTDDEARRDAGYALATPRAVSVLLADGRRLDGTVRVYRPAGRDRLSDWARHGDRFRYVETADTTFIVNVDHVVEVREGPGR